MSGAQGSGAAPSIRQLHRWVSIAFTVTVITNFVVRTKGIPPAWITYSPLLPQFAALRQRCLAAGAAS
jgi:hypothetical protein